MGWLLLWSGGTSASLPSEHPKIKTRQFSVKVIRKSPSHPIYLFEDTQNATPTVGKILLLRQTPDRKNIMAVRILKINADKKTFAASQVRNYLKETPLNPQALYSAVEKVSNPSSPIEPQRALGPLQELEQKTKTVFHAQATPQKPTSVLPALPLKSEAKPVQLLQETQTPYLSGISRAARSKYKPLSPLSEIKTATINPPAFTPSSVPTADKIVSSQSAPSTSVDFDSDWSDEGADDGFETADLPDDESASPPAEDGSVTLDDYSTLDENSSEEAEGGEESAVDLDSEEEVMDVDAQSADETEDFEFEAPAALNEEPQTTSELRIADYDPELDAGSSPPPDERLEAMNRKLMTDDDDAHDPLDEISAQELEIFDKDRNWFSLEMGYMRNSGANGESNYYSAVGIRYAMNIGEFLFLKGYKTQDSLSLDFGTFIYKVLNYESTSGDSYTIAPFLVNLRYNILFQENMGFFLYGGLVKNFVISEYQSSTEAVDALSGFSPAAGVGFIYTIGPRWQLKTALGLDSITAGIVLRF